MVNWVLLGYLKLLCLLRLSSRVKLVHHAQPAELTAVDSSTGAKRKTSLGQVLDKCPSLTGVWAFFTPTFWLARSVRGWSGWSKRCGIVADPFPHHRTRRIASRRSGHFSTVYCTLAKFDYDPVEYTRHYIRVPDGGTIGIDFTPPISEENPLDDRPVLVVSQSVRPPHQPTPHRAPLDTEE